MYQSTFKNLYKTIAFLVLINFSITTHALDKTYEQLKSFLPKKGYSELAQQNKHALGGMKSSKSEMLLYPFNLGPTGIQGIRYLEKMVYEVSSLAKGSPADTLIKVGDVIYGANGREFGDYKIDEESARRAPNPQMGQAIEESEARLKGKLTLMLRRDGKEMKVALMLKTLGSFGKQFPKVSSKADYLAELNARILLAKQLPNGMWSAGLNNRPSHYATCMSALALMAMDDKRYKKAVKKAFEAVIKSDVKGFESWFVAYRALFIGEYYLRYKSKKVLPVLKEMVEDICTRHFYYNGIYGYGHGFTKGNYRYGGINVCTANVCMALAMAKTCGLKIPLNMDKHLAMTIERLAPDGAMNYAWMAKRKGPITSVRHNENSGRTGMGLMAYKLLGGRAEHYRKMLDYTLLNSEHADCSHASGGSIGWLWGSISLAFASQKYFTEHMQKRIWYINFNRQWDGGFYCQPSTHGQFRPSDLILGPHYIAASNILLFKAAKRNLLITGKKSPLQYKALYKSEVLASAEYFRRQAERVDVAEVESLLSRNTPRTLAVLKKYLSKNSLEGKSYEKNRKLIYSKYLKRTLTDIFKSKASDEQKSQAACILLGLRYNVSAVKLASGKRHFRLKTTALKHGDLSITIDGYKTRKKMVVGTEKGLNTQVAVNAEQKMAVMNIDWNGIKFKRSLNLSDA
ncbi:MAG: hypothetical protein HRT88_17785, partial [Lentisphaeraceae bacterium]|nr:hypothetical protein [Lentisphaeraceae bacterium]